MNPAGLAQAERRGYLNAHTAKFILKSRQGFSEVKSQNLQVKSQELQVLKFSVLDLV